MQQVEGVWREFGALKERFEGDVGVLRGLREDVWILMDMLHDLKGLEGNAERDVKVEGLLKRCRGLRVRVREIAD